MTEVEQPDWADQPFPEKPFRLSKFFLRTLFDAQMHLIRRGEHFPAHWSEEELSKKLRNAAWWRGTTIRVSHCPEGAWVQSATVVDDDFTLAVKERERLVRLVEENDQLKQEIAELRSEVWQLKNP